VKPSVSVIVATRNRRDLLAKTLDALGAERWPPDRFEIIVADNRSTDGTRALVQSVAWAARGPAVRYLYVARPGKSHAVNAALDAASGDILAFVDDDVQPDPDWLERIAAAFEETGADFVAGRVKPLWQVPPPMWMSRALYGVLAVPDNGDARIHIAAGARHRVMPIGANMAVRRDVVRRIGGLRVDLGKLEGTLRTGEDHEYYLRMLHAGFRGVYEPTAIVHHWVPAARLTRSYVRRWLYQNGRDVARLESTYVVPMRRLLGVPRYLWRQAAGDLWRACRATLRGNAREQTAALMRIVWLGGYARESWR
jgi:glycosyltransferase involved in cell wall biosynthesis